MADTSLYLCLPHRHTLCVSPHKAVVYTSTRINITVQHFIHRGTEEVQRPVVPNHTLYAMARNGMLHFHSTTFTVSKRHRPQVHHFSFHLCRFVLSFVLNFYVYLFYVLYFHSKVQKGPNKPCCTTIAKCVSLDAQCI